MARQIAIAVVEHEGRFLIGQRPEGVALAGYWEFPGGKIETGESAEEGAVRECLEEAGLLVEPTGVYLRHVEPYAHGTVELHFIACRLAPEQARGRLASEGADCARAGNAESGRFRWVERGELRGYAFPAGNRELLELLTGNKS